LSTDKFEQWAIVEIMGHQKFAGWLTEQTIAGAGMLRLDVPAVGELPGFTRLFNTASVYLITPTSEQVARQVAAALKQQPVTVWDLPAEVRIQKLAPMTSKGTMMSETSENAYAAPEVEQQSSGANNKLSDTAGCIVLLMAGGLLLMLISAVAITGYRQLYPTNPKFKQGDWVKVTSGFYRDQIGQVESASQDFPGSWQYGVDPITSIGDQIAERDLTACDHPVFEPELEFDWRTYPHPRRVR
jgi:hypothetical protein